MTAFHHYELLCDTDGCDASFNAAEARADVTRQKAATMGWVHVVTPRMHGGPARSADYCQRCAQQREADGLRERMEACHG